MKQILLIEINSDAFNTLIDEGHLSVNDVIVVERWQEGDPEITAKRRLMLQVEKDANTAYSAAMKVRDKMKEEINNMKKL